MLVATRDVCAGRDSGGCELGMVAKHLHKGQGIMPNGGKGWASRLSDWQIGRTGERGRHRERGGVVNPLFRKRTSLAAGSRAGQIFSLIVC